MSFIGFPRSKVKKINSSQLREKLIKVYEKFIENPENKENREEIRRLSDLYDNSTEYSFYEKSIEKSIDYLWFLLQGGRHEYFTKEKVFNEAKKILEYLKKS